MKLYIYIDGFNLYYGCLKNTPNKWLDVFKLCQYLFPHVEIVKIKYFTAPIKNRENDIDKERPNRQQIYFRALRTIQNLEIIEGTFLSHNVSMKLSTGKGFATVIKSEEKGTDVNIATHLIHDAHNKKFEKAVVISNDSDLVTPVRIVTKEIDLSVTVISPFKRNNIELMEAATNVKKVRRGVLGISQFPHRLKDSTGEFSIPDKWISKGLAFFLPLETRPKDYPALEKMVGKFWHTGIIYENRIFECFNHDRKSIDDFSDSKKKTLADMQAVFVNIIVNTDKLNSEINSGTDCSEYVARVVGLSANTGSKKQYWPEEVYNYILDKFAAK